MVEREGRVKRYCDKDNIWYGERVGLKDTVMKTTFGRERVELKDSVMKTTFGMERGWIEKIL